MVKIKTIALKEKDFYGLTKMSAMLIKTPRQFLEWLVEHEDEVMEHILEIYEKERGDE